MGEGVGMGREVRVMKDGGGGGGNEEGLGGE